jgi:hypothetical protein
MKNLNNIAAICAALLLGGGASGFTTARPAIAQGNRPATDVRVINSAADAVPVTVSSLPAVQVSSLPAVQVGNGVENPVPVSVTNLPAIQTPPEPITLSGVLIVEGGETFASADLSGVPAGETLVLESFNYETSTPDHNQRHLLTVETFHNGLSRFQRFVPEGRFDTDEGFEVGQHIVKIFADPGTLVRIRVARSRATAASTIHVTMTGYLVAAP